jgi:hypothetical protein
MATVKRFSIVNIWRSVGDKVVDTARAVRRAYRVSGGPGGNRHVLSQSRRRDLSRPPVTVPSLGLLLGDGLPRGPGVQAIRLPGQRRFPVTPHCAFDLPEIRLMRPSGQASRSAAW